jgi:hypothetical protein
MTFRCGVGSKRQPVGESKVPFDFSNRAWVQEGCEARNMQIEQWINLDPREILGDPSRQEHDLERPCTAQDPRGHHFNQLTAAPWMISK